MDHFLLANQAIVIYYDEATPLFDLHDLVYFDWIDIVIIFVNLFVDYMQFVLFVVILWWSIKRPHIFDAVFECQ